MNDRPMTRAFAEFLVSKHNATGKRPDLIEPTKLCGKRACTALAKRLPSLRCDKVTIGSRPFDELRSISEHSLLFGHFDANGLLVGALLIPRVLVLDLITVLLGGDTTDSPGRLHRKPTTFDVRVAKLVADIWIASLAEPLSETCPAFAVPPPQLIVDQTKLAIDADCETTSLLFELNRLEAVYNLEFIVLASQLATRVPCLTGTNAAAQQSLNAASTAAVRIEAVLDARDLTLDDLSNILPGDVLALVDESAACVRIEAAGEALFWGRPGRQGTLMVVKIADTAQIDAQFTGSVAASDQMDQASR